MLTLYFSPGSSAMATHIALHEVGVAFEARPTLLYQNAHRSPGYLAINAEGKVPTLVIDGRPLTEVAATLWYLARQYPDAGLLPQQLRGDGGALGEAFQLRPHDRAVHAAGERALRESAICAGHDAVAANDAGIAQQPLGHEVGMLDDVGRMRNEPRH